MSDARLDLLTTRCCSPMNTWATVRGFLVVALERERIEGQIAVLEEMLSELMPMRHENDYNVRAVPQVSFLNKIASLRKELGE